MTLLDLVLALLFMSGAVAGYRLGFVTRVLSWVGLLVGLAVAIRVLPMLLRTMGDPDPTSALLVAVGTVFVGSFVGQALGVLVGARLRPAREGSGAVIAADGVAGAVAGVAGIAIIVWLLLPLLGGASGFVARQATGSAVVRALDTHLPPPPDTVRALRSFVGEGDFPQVFEEIRPTPALGPPPPETGISTPVAQQVRASVVKVESLGCGRLQNGTGFVVEPGIVMTNAHVVAGSESTELIDAGGRRHRGLVIGFDPQRDLAAIAVEGIAGAPLALHEPVEGAIGGVFGHPGGEPLRIAPTQIAREIAATGRDIYGSARADRSVLELAAVLRPGDSGAPVVSPDGVVVGIVFAIATDRADVAYALTPDEMRTLLAEGLTSSGSGTGACIR